MSTARVISLTDYVNKFELCSAGGKLMTVAYLHASRINKFEFGVWDLKPRERL